MGCIIVYYFYQETAVPYGCDEEWKEKDGVVASYTKIQHVHSLVLDNSGMLYNSTSFVQ